ncbi:MAG: LacI family transcriptional regulator [Actinobacteria bacterium]|nr:LacI family transcriptional regulator [Actinomycetota bacterium]
MTIKDVARLAGVSPTTVSHALGGQRPVSEATRRRVLDAVAELGYRPHPGARSLKASGTGVIAVCAVNAVSSSSHADLEYIHRIMRGVTRAAREHEYAVVYVPDTRDGVHWERLLFDGAIVSGPQKNDDNLRFLRAQGLPYVTIGRDPDRPDEGYWVDNDPEESARLVLDHFHAHGARRVAAITWPTTDYWTKQVLRAYGAWCEEHDLAAHVEELTSDSAEALDASARRLLESSSPPDAVFGVYELPAIAVLRAAAQLGIAVPGDLMVAGPSDFGLAEGSQPPMTTLEYDAEGHGREAADMLIRLVRGERVEDPQRVLPVRLVERASTQR